MKSREEQLWDHIDGTAPAEERAALERALQNDEELQREWALRRKLHEGLRQMEAEQPSIRFTQNLMERLPELYRRIQIAPLVGKAWVRAYLAFFLICVLGLFGFGFDVLGSYAPSFTFNWAFPYLTVDLEASFPFRLAVIVMSLTSAALFLMWLDKRLRGSRQG